MADREEEEQIEVIKRWWKENGTSTIVGIVAALAIVFGYQGWRDHEREVGEDASAIYEDMVSASSLDNPLAQLDNEKLATAKFLGGRLKAEFANSTYAHLAALLLAKIAVEEGDLPAAERELKWALDSGIDDSLEVLVRIRLARVKNAMGAADEALAILATVDPGEHRPSFEEIKGDIYRTLGDNTQARESYQRALTALDTGDVRPMLQMKLDDLVSPTADVVADDALLGDAAAESAPTEEAK